MASFSAYTGRANRWLSLSARVVTRPIPGKKGLNSKALLVTSTNPTVEITMAANRSPARSSRIIPTPVSILSYRVCSVSSGPRGNSCTVR